MYNVTAIAKLMDKGVCLGEMMHMSLRFSNSAQVSLMVIDVQRLNIHQVIGKRQADSMVTLVRYWLYYAKFISHKSRKPNVLWERMGGQQDV